MGLNQFEYGGGDFDEKSVFVKSFTQQMIPAQNGRPFMLHKMLQVEGKVLDPDGDAAGKLLGIYNALSQNGFDAGFSGTTMFLSDQDAIGRPGVVVSKPCSHSEVKGAEGVTYIRWNAGFEAYYPMADAGAILAFKETVSFTNNNGMPIYVERIPVTGLPILQQTTSASWYFATQSGTKTMAFQQPDPPALLFPGALRTSGNSGVQYSYSSPDIMRGHSLGYTTTWKYEYISALPFFSYPNFEY